MTKRRVRAVVSLLAAATCSGSLVLLAGGPAGGTVPGVSFKFSGAGKGSVAPGPVASCLAGAAGGGIIEIDDLVGPVAGYTNVGSWTVVINENKNGTFKIKENSTKDPLVALNPLLKNHNAAQSDKEDLDGTSGTVSVHGVSGTLRATVRNLTSSGYGKTIKISGSWTCPAG